MPAAGTRPPGTVKRNGKAPRPPTALPGRIHALGRQGADQPLRLVFGGRRAPEIVPDRGDRLPDLLHRGAGSNFNAHGVLGLYAVIRTATHPTAPLGYGQLPICAPAYPGRRRRSRSHSAASPYPPADIRQALFEQRRTLQGPQRWTCAPPLRNRVRLLLPPMGGPGSA